MSSHYEINEFDNVIMVPKEGVKIPKEVLPEPSYEEIERILISKKCIKARINALAKQIAKDYSTKKEIYCLVIMKGALIFFADLMRALHKYPYIEQIKFDIIKAKSYVGTESKGSVDIIGDVENVKDKDILIVEDIVDTGITLSELKKYLLERGAARVRICALLSKSERRKVNLDIDYLGFEIPNVFIVGYGIDYEEKYRALPHIAYLKH